MDFITKSETPLHKKITYVNMVCDYWPLNQEKHIVRLTVRGDTLEYAFGSTSQAASLIETKMIINSFISDSAKGVHVDVRYYERFLIKSQMKDP